VTNTDKVIEDRVCAIYIGMNRENQELLSECYADKENETGTENQFLKQK
jgi:hypothetical protein